MLALALDTETTGIPDQNLPADHESQPRCAAIAALLVDLDTRVNVGSYFAIIRPDGWTMPDAAREINKLTDEMLTRYGVPIARAMATINDFVDLKVLVCCHNVTFDSKIIRGEFRRARMRDRYADMPYFCTYQSTPRTIPGGRKLQNTYSHWTGREAPKAHAAMTDALMVREILFAMIDKGVKLEAHFPGQSTRAGAAALADRHPPITPAAF